MASLAKKNIARWIETYAKSSGNLTLVESGTYLGETSAWAADIFHKVVTIELSEHYFEMASARFSARKNVTCLQGDSGALLDGMRGALSGPLLFWLDGHYSFGDTAKSSGECPLLAELAALRGFAESPCIMIDDARYFTEPPPPPHRMEDWPDLAAVFTALRAINSDYYLVIVEDVLIAAPPVVALSLKQFLRAQRVGSDRPKAGGLSEYIGGRAGQGKPVRLHLGCGATVLDGYINVDFPATEHNVMTVHPDFEEDIRTLELPKDSVDEIRLHHVFEHFDRVTALALLIRWHRWLRPNGVLHLETPDFEGCAAIFAGSTEPQTKAGIVRHLAGDQAAKWAFHLDHWYEERYRQTLERLGYTVSSVHRSRWDRPPHLANIEVIASKTNERLIGEQLAAADDVLWLSTVDPVEAPTHKVWRTQLRAVFNLPCDDDYVAPPARMTSGTDFAPVPQRVLDLVREMGTALSSVPISQVQGYNAANRDAWVAAKARSIDSGARVLDVGAGTCPYRHLFAHCDYVTHDFTQYKGYQGHEGTYGSIDLVSDILKIPAPAGSFDAILCTEVLEHVPDPMGAVAEMARLLRPGGRLFVTAPLGSGLHQEPYHYYGGYTPHWYRHVCDNNNLDIIEIGENGGFFALLGQECARVAWTVGKFRHLYRDAEAVGHLFGELLPRYLYQFDERAKFNQFTAGYFMEAVKNR